MRRSLATLALGVAVLFTGAPALAQPAGGQPAIPSSEWTGFYASVHFGAGTGSLIDAIDDNCDDFDDAFGLECTGDDRGPVWAVGGDVRWRLNRLFDVGARTEYSKPSDVTLDASGLFEGFSLTTALRAEGSLWSLAGQVGVSPVPRFRLYSGYGGTRFNFDVTGTVSAFGLTETQTENFSGWGHHFFAGAEYSVTPRLSIFGEGARSWLSDDSSDAELDEFDEVYSRWMIGARFELARPRWR